MKKQKICLTVKEASALLSLATKVGKITLKPKSKIPDTSIQFGIVIGPNLQKLTQPADWPADAPPYHTPAGWAWEKQMAEYKLRETFGREARNWNCIDWFLYMADTTGDQRFMIVAERLMEIERGE